LLSEPRTPPAGTEGVVDALRRLVVFGVDQAGAYRELYAPVAEQIGPGFSTRLTLWLEGWAGGGEPGVVVLTGNAGTGKTAAAQAYCEALGEKLPETDAVTYLGSSLLVKDVSGIALRSERASAFRLALAGQAERQSLLCANEGILRDAAEDLQTDHPELRQALDGALRDGSAAIGGLRVVNVNRQRLTEPALWQSLLDYLTEPALWEGCDNCPGGEGSAPERACPMRANADALRNPEVREVLRSLVRLASGEAVQTMRELLALLAYSICGDSSSGGGTAVLWSCREARSQALNRGRSAFTASSGYYNLIFGEGLSREAKERSPLLDALDRLGAGRTADLEVDEWLRDVGRADPSVRALAGYAAPGSHDDGRDAGIGGSRSPLDRIRTAAGDMTFSRLGEIVSISEDDETVRAGLRALVAADPPALEMWRRRVLLEASRALAGPPGAIARLTELSYGPDLLELAARVAAGADVVTSIKQIIKGLNFLVTGFADASEGLIIPEPASLFARNPGSFRPARPAFVHAKVDTSRVALAMPDAGGVAEILDVDGVEVRLYVDGDRGLSLTIGPRLYQALREAEEFKGPVSQGTAEMTDLRSFYGRLAARIPREPGMQVADPNRSALVRVQLPHFSAHD